MSADLLAAFGIDDKAKNNGHQQTSNVQPADQEVDPFAAFATNVNKENTLSISNKPGTKKSFESTNNVLFDAEDFEDEDDDDFGDFEGVNEQHNAQQLSTKANPASTGLVDLLDDNTGTIDASESFRSHAESLKGQENEDDWGQFTAAEPEPIVAEPVQPSTNIHTPSSSSQRIQDKASVITKPNVNADKMSIVDDEAFETWDDFEDGRGQTQGAEDSAVLKVSPKLPTEKRERPMNIPPPAVILGLLTKAVTILASQIKTATNGSIGSKSAQVYRVSGRVISGRTLRWKRDTILAQSTRIGAAGRSGMKLTVVDKGETRREDQEYEELLSTWTTRLHSLNQAMLREKVQKPPVNLSAKLMVRTVSGPDVLTASHVCPICGLKRDERVNGIDVSVTDTFGDFWIEYWGHTDCHDFWYGFKELLDQR